MSPIYTRPIREQAEHDRVIRQLQVRYKRKHDVAINPGSERNQSVMVGELEFFPDLILYSTDKSHRIEGTVEVETGESVHLLEARAEWGVFSKLKAPFHLYVPPQSIESAKRLCEEQQFPVAEIWTYHMAFDQVRFTQVYRSPNAPKPSLPAAPKPAKPTTSKAKTPPSPEPKAVTAEPKPVKAEPKVAKVEPKAATKPAPKARPAKPVAKGAKGVAKAPKPSVKFAPKSKPVKPSAKSAVPKKRR